MEKRMASNQVNCPFYSRTGTCKYGHSCYYLHVRPEISPTLLLWHMYHPPNSFNAHSQPFHPKKFQEHFENFYEEVFEELSMVGEIKSLNVCDNLADHMIGNVYVEFREEEHAANALRYLEGRYYAGRAILASFSPVTDFGEAICKQNEAKTCNRGGQCNFLHLKRISRGLRRRLWGRRSQSRSPHRHRGYEQQRSHGSCNQSTRHDDREYHERQS